MPNFVKSGKYYYKVNEKSGKKTRISKDEYMKYKSSKSRKRMVKSSQKNIVLHNNNLPVKKNVHKVSNVRSSNSLEEILHEEIRKKLKQIGEEKLTITFVNFSSPICLRNIT